MSNSWFEAEGYEFNSALVPEACIGGNALQSIANISLHLAEIIEVQKEIWSLFVVR